MFVSVLASTRSSIPAMLGHARALVETSAPPPRKLAWSVGAPLRRVLEKARVGTVGHHPRPQPEPEPQPRAGERGDRGAGR